MQKAYNYTYSQTEGLQREETVSVDQRDLIRIMERVHSRGSNTDDPELLAYIDLFVNFDPNNLVIQEWDEGNDFKKPQMESAYPWLRTFVDDPEAPAQPADDPGIRALIANDLVEQFNYRLWKANRFKQVESIVVDVDGLVFDGDETAQTRMARAVNIAHAEMLEQLITYLQAHRDNTTISANELLVGMSDVLTATRDALSTTWMLADNTPAEVTPTQLKEALKGSMLTMGAVWVPPQS